MLFRSLQYTLLGSEHQTVDYDVRHVDGGFLFVPVYPTTYIIDENFYNRVPEDYSVDNYSIWCIRKIFYLHLSIPRAKARRRQITIFIIFHQLQSIKL